MFVKDFKQDFKIITNAIKNKTPFAFARFADGEHAIMNSIPLSGMDGWHFDPEKHKLITYGVTRSYFREKLIGISCPCCDMPKFKDLSYIASNDYTFSNIFVNANNDDWVNFNVEVAPDVIVCSERIKQVPASWSETRVLKLPHLNFDWYCFQEDKVKAVEKYLKSLSGKTVYFAVGPIGKALLDTTYTKTNTFVDIGSSLDHIFYGNPTRDYHNKDSNFKTKVCSFNAKS